MRCLVLLALTGCSLYFDSSSRRPPEEDVEVDAPPAPAPESDAAPSVTCPKPGTYAEILYPKDGATDVPQPVPIEMHVVIPNTLDGKGIFLSDANGQPVGLDHADASCSVGIPPIQTGPTQDVTWTECYKDLEPDSLYTWHVWLTCYDETGIHELATSTFRTAP